MLEFLASHPNLLGLGALLLFVTLSALVALYLATDRRQAHHRRMEAMALDDDQVGGGQADG